MFLWDEIETLATKWHNFNANVYGFQNLEFFLERIYFLVLLSLVDVASFISIAAIKPIANTQLI